MSTKSNDQGRAYEFAYLLVLHQEISKIRPATIELNSSYYAAQRAWETLTPEQQDTYKLSALSGAQTIFELESLILEDGADELELKLQSDDKGEFGDVRDVLIIRRGIQWEIGLSVKHNHFAVKHSRLSHNLDFGAKWYNIPCSEKYWDEVNPLFSKLKEYKAQGMKWNEIENKDSAIYVPLLNAFKNELTYQNQREENKVPQRLVEYLLGKFDFYKVISIDKKRITLVQTFNLHGTLNQQGKKPSAIKIPVTDLPTRIVSIEFKPNSSNTLELYMDCGWQFNFRIHNASSKVEPSLKFDVQIIGMPTTIVTFERGWK